jgi:glycosyltransferase involved in cell wall biosynthesis
MPNLDILVHDGSPTKICPECLYGDEYRYGTGGSELFLLTMCEAWGNLGYKVRLYNDPHDNYKQVSWMEQLPIEAFNPDDNRDYLINFRSPSINATRAKGLKVWLSCDQYSTGDYRRFAPFMDKIVCISQHHLDFFKKVYGIENAVAIDIPVREKDFVPQEQIKNRLIFTSIPDRGLRNLLSIYPDLLREIPDISLVITSDYRLWGASPQNEQYRIEWVKFMNTVQFRGALPRLRYIYELSISDMMVYPCTYPELFCISVAEAQWAGVYPITSSAGALKTTNMGTIIDVDPDTAFGKKLFIDKTVELLDNREKLSFIQQEVKSRARERFSLDKILKEWDEKVFK